MANNYNPWMTVSQIQDLQTFLSYWGTVEYEQLVLQNEYYNWNDQVENSLATSGVTGIDQNGNPYCLSNTSSNSANFCAYINNIRSVFPPDVYTDELVIIGNGLAINAFPGGLAQEPLSGDVSWGTYYAGGGTSSNNIGPLGLTASFMANHVMNFHANSQATFLVADNTTVTPTVPGLVTNAGTLFNSLPSNTTSGSVQEGYSLQIAGHYPIEYSDLNGLGGQQYGTQNATSGNLTFQAALVAGLGQDTDGSFSPTGLSSAKYSASDIYFLMADSTFGIENPANNKSQMWFSWVAVGGDYTNGSYSGGYNGTCANNCIVSGGLNYWDPTMAPVIACGGSNPPSCPSNPGQPPVFAVLLKRNWWNESTLLQTWAQASNTNPPALAAPPTFSGLPPSGLSTIALSPTSVQITFTAPEAPSGYTIQGYVGGCSGTDSSGSIVSGTVNGTASPLAVSTLQDGLTYECAVQTQYSNGSGTVITSTSSNSAKASTAVPTAPTINSISSPAAGELQINFTPSNSNGGSAITNYVTACTDSGHSTGYAGGTTSPALVKNLTGGVAYTCNMVAQNVNGYSPSSNLMVATPSQ
jgi:hypothetical protein